MDKEYYINHIVLNSHLNILNCKPIPSTTDSVSSRVGIPHFVREPSLSGYLPLFEANLKITPFSES